MERILKLASNMWKTIQSIESSLILKTSDDFCYPVSFPSAPSINPDTGIYFFQNGTN